MRAAAARFRFPGVDQAAASERGLDREGAAIGEEDVVPVLVDLEVLSALEPAHDRGQSGQQTAVLAGFGAGDHQRDARLVDQDGVGLVDDRGVKRRALVTLDQRPAVHLIGELQAQAVAQQIEAGLLRGDVGDVARVGLATRLGRHALLHHAHGDAQALVHRAHPGRVAPSEVVVDGEDVRAAAGERGEERGRHGGQRLPLAGRHLGDGPAMEREAAEDLLVVQAQAESAASRLAHQREAVDQAIVVAAGAELERASSQLLVGERCSARFALADGGDDVVDRLRPLRRDLSSALVQHSARREQASCSPTSHGDTAPLLGRS